METLEYKPIGNHIQITKPEEINPSVVIREKENLSKAVVKSISPDAVVPFKENDTILFYTDKHILLKDEYYINTEMICLYD